MYRTTLDGEENAFSSVFSSDLGLKACGQIEDFLRCFVTEINASGICSIPDNESLTSEVSGGTLSKLKELVCGDE